MIRRPSVGTDWPLRRYLFCLWRSPDHGMVSVVVVVVVLLLLLVGATFVLSDLWQIQKNL